MGVEDRKGLEHSSCVWLVDVGGEGPIFANMYTLSSKAGLLPVKTTSFDHAKVCGRALKCMIQFIVLAVGPLPSSRPPSSRPPSSHPPSSRPPSSRPPSSRPPVVIHMTKAPRPFPCCCTASGRKLGKGQEVSLNMVFVERYRNKVGNFLHISALQEIVMMCLGPIHPS